MTRVVAIGECMVELSPSGEGLLRRRFAGDAYNTAVYLKRARPQIEVSFLTATGEDPLSLHMRQAWAAEAIAVPGVLTSAYLTLRLYTPEFDYAVVPFDEIIDEVVAGNYDAGLLIHEGQLTFHEQGLDKIVDLGAWWKKETGLPLPMGGNAIKRDLGVELHPEDVPPIQKRIVNAARGLGKPVIVATQMLESMIESPTPTRAEVSDVANAVYDGADAVMLSAETAAGQWPEEAVTMMNRIAQKIETDESYSKRIRFLETPPDPTTADALSHACMTIADTVAVSALVVYTGSGSSARRVARERPAVELMVLTPSVAIARRVALLWGCYAVATKDIGNFEEMVAKGKRMALRHGFGRAGSKLVILAGVPFGTPGSTNLLHVVTLTGDELASHGS